jgi:tRNA modification GTPase
MVPLDTIAAIATPGGHGGIGIIRLSGPAALSIAEAIVETSLQPRHAHFCHFKQDGETIDSGIVLFFPTPNSFTGEDVIELQGHGGPVVLDILLRACCDHGARLAQPGEFSERAFLNDKIDLTQAEAIADLINSSTKQGALNASRTLQGEFSSSIEKLVSAVTQLRIYIEAAIDFPEEEIDFIAEGSVAEKLREIENSFDEVASKARQGSLIRDGMKLVITGKPNAGKSSVLNALSGQDSAIVTPIEGTTRDILREHIEISGMPIHIVDTAGLRDSPDTIEQEGIRRAKKEMETADRILLVVDSSSADNLNSENIWPEEIEHLSGEIPTTIIYNKCDISKRKAEAQTNLDIPTIHLSAKTGEGLELLKNHLKTCMGLSDSNEGSFSARRRHLDALKKARECLQQGIDQLEQAGAGELLAEDLRQCQNYLGEITGTFTSDDLLGEIFSSFCIGK